jgi:hypothetical protein
MAHMAVGVPASRRVPVQQQWALQRSVQRRQARKAKSKLDGLVEDL